MTRNKISLRCPPPSLHLTLTTNTTGASTTITITTATTHTNSTTHEHQCRRHQIQPLTIACQVRSQSQKLRGFRTRSLSASTAIDYREELPAPKSIRIKSTSEAIFFWTRSQLALGNPIIALLHRQTLEPDNPTELETRYISFYPKVCVCTASSFRHTSH